MGGVGGTTIYKHIKTIHILGSELFAGEGRRGACPPPPIESAKDFVDPSRFAQIQVRVTGLSGLLSPSSSWPDSPSRPSSTPWSTSANTSGSTTRSCTWRHSCLPGPSSAPCPSSPCIPNSCSSRKVGVQWRQRNRVARKNGTPVICNFNNIVEKMSLLFNLLDRKLFFRLNLHQDH